MRLGLLSDIHGNLPALLNCIRQLEMAHVDSWICLGDTVGYGPWPNECLDILREREIPSVLGNHDAGAIGKQSLRIFQEPNASLLRWTRDHLSVENREYLLKAPFIMERDGWMTVHSSPYEPEKWHYLRSAVRCRKLLETIDKEICFIGHTHIPGFVADSIGIYRVQKGHKFIINPGSVGQSRNEDKRASCGLFDTDSFEYQNYRVEYPIEETIRGYARLEINQTDARRLLYI